LRSIGRVSLALACRCVCLCATYKGKVLITIFVLSLFVVSVLGRREVNPYDGAPDDEDDIYKQRAQRSASKRAVENRRPAFGGSDDDESDDAPRGARSFKDDDDDEMDDTDPATRSRLKALERSFKEAFNRPTGNTEKDVKIDMDKIRELLSQDRKDRAGRGSRTQDADAVVIQPNEESIKTFSEETETVNVKSSEEKISLVDL